MAEKNPKTIIRKDTWTSIFIAALFTVAKIWKQHKCSLTGEWIKKMWCTHTHSEILLSHKKWKLAIYSTMDGLGGYYADWNMSDRERQILHDSTDSGTQKSQHTSEHNKRGIAPQI